MELPMKAMKAKAEAMSSKGEPMKTVKAKASASVMAKAKKAMKNKKAKASASVKAKAKKATKTKKAKASAPVKKAMQKAMKKAKAKEGRCEICRLVHPLSDLNVMRWTQDYTSFTCNFCARGAAGSATNCCECVTSLCKPRLVSPATDTTENVCENQKDPT
jgi:hypothetical protein